MTITSSDLATVLNRLAGRFAHEGESTLSTTRSWADTIRAASYGDDKGSNRWALIDGELVPIPNDPTGDQAVDPDEVAQLHQRLRALMRQLHSVAAEVENIMDQASPDPRKHPKRPDDKLDEDRWCQSCKADRGYLEPVSTHDDGRIRYRGECRWCHDFKADTGRYPTPGLLRRRHAGFRITEADIATALGRKAS